METTRCRSVPRSKISRTFHKVISLKNTTKISSTTTAAAAGICKFADDDYDGKHKESKTTADDKVKRSAVLEALLAKMFAEVTSIKAAYAELQVAQNPYCIETIQSADHDVVEELKTLSHLKRSFVRDELDLISPQVTVMLAEIQEQQSLMKTYQIMIWKLEAETEAKSTEVDSMKKVLNECVAFNRSIEKKLNASGQLQELGISILNLNPSHFVQCLHYALRSVKSFVKLMVREMESARWDLDAAAEAIEPELGISISILNRSFVFESFVAKTMFEGFNHPDFTSSKNDESSEQRRRESLLNKFKKMKSANLRHYLAQNPSSSFAKFTRAKYTLLVHAKMECSLFGNLSQRKAVNGGAFPDTEFFGAFAEMARRVWVLNLLAMSFGERLHVFQVRKNCRFSEVYMESVSDGGANGGDLRVGFTVVPGFKIGSTVIQSQVYLTPAADTVRR
ncbi:Protein GRAVITROPIC IN THE LIGHT 1 [Linum perenne]